MVLSLKFDPFDLSSIKNNDLSVNRWESANKIYGRTCNPYDMNRTPGGSSGGEGSLLVGQ